METLYRKVAVSERNPTKEDIYNTSRGFLSYSKVFGWVTIQNYTTPNPKWWLEEIPDTTDQLEADNIANTFLKPYEKEFLDCLEKLQADKAELLEALEEAKQFLNYVQAPATPAIRLRMEIESIIQKHKS